MVIGYYSGLLWTSLHRNRPLWLLHSEASRSDELDPVHGSQHHRLPLLRLAHYLGADKVPRNIEDVTEQNDQHLHVFDHDRHVIDHDLHVLDQD